MSILGDDALWAANKVSLDEQYRIDCIVAGDNSAAFQPLRHEYTLQTTCVGINMEIAGQRSISNSHY